MATPSEFRRDMEEAGDRLFPEVRAAMNKHGRDFAYKDMLKHIRSGVGVKWRGGNLGRSFGWEEVGDTSDSWRGIAYTTSKSAPLQEHGGEVRPVTAKKLAIPLKAAKHGSGIPKGPPRSFPNTFIQKSKRGNLLIFQMTGKKRPKNLPEGANDPSIVPLFVLKDRVRVPGRLGFFDLWKDGSDERRALLARATARALRGGNGG